MPTDTQSAARSRQAAGLMGFQALALILAGVWSGVDGASARSWSFAATLFALAGCVGALAVLLHRGRAAARTPSLLWNFLLLPAAFTVGDSGAPWIGWTVVAVSMATIIAVVRAPAEAGDTSTDD